MVNSPAVDVPLGQKGPIKLVSMQMSAKQADDYAIPTSVQKDVPKYPWGLRLNLNDDVLLKLGIPLPEVSNTFTLVAFVEVTRASATEDQEGKDLSCELQITDMRLIDTNTAPDKAAKLWPDAEPA